MTQNENESPDFILDQPMVDLLCDDLAYDVIALLEPKKKETQEAKERLLKKIHSNFTHYIDEKQVNAIVAMKQLFNITTPNCPIFDGGLPEPVMNFQEVTQKAAQVCFHYHFQKANGLYLKSISPDSKKKPILFKHRSEWLEAARERIENKCLGQYAFSVDSVNIKQCHYLLACIQYERSRNIIPRNDRTPPYKRELLLKAEAAISACGDSEACIKKTHTEILYELNKIEPDLFSKTFQYNVNTLFSGDAPPLKTARDFILYHEYLELTKNVSEDDNRPFLSEENEPSVHKENFPIYQTYARLRIFRGADTDDNRNAVLANLKEAQKSMVHYNLYTRAWDDFIQLVKDVKKAGFGDVDLSNILYRVWETCEAHQKNMHMGFQIRQYWSRLQDLYTLAIHSALNVDDKNSLLNAVRVIDSLKGKPPAMWSHVVDVLKKEKNADDAERLEEMIERFFSHEHTASEGKFVPATEWEIKFFKSLAMEENSQKRYDFEEIPKGWAAVHLYIENSGGRYNGWAVLIITEDKDSEIQIKKHPIDSNELTFLKEKYETWLKAYRASKENKEKSSRELRDLCIQLWKTFSMLKKSIHGKNLIWVPHDFLHRLPIHAALLEDEEGNPQYLFDCEASTYLPAWSMALKQEASETKDKICLRYLEEKESLNRNNCPYDLDFWDCKKDMATKEDLVCLLSQSPFLMVLVCHGIADEVDPFKSRICIGKEGITLFELCTLDIMLRGTRIYNTMCEADMTPCRRQKIDEHISIASVFLNKGCREILGTLWESYVNLTNHLVNDISAGHDKKPFWEIVHGLKEISVKDFKDIARKTLKEQKKEDLDNIDRISEKTVLFYTSMYRAIGYPHQDTDTSNPTGALEP